MECRVWHALRADCGAHVEAGALKRNAWLPSRGSRAATCSPDLAALGIETATR